MKKLMIPFGFLLLFFVACKKDKDEKNTTRSELIVGTWTAVAFGTDANGDNILQESEREPIGEGVSLVQTYNAKWYWSNCYQRTRGARENNTDNLEVCG